MSNANVFITQDVYDRMIEDAREDKPLETCALLMGNGNYIDEYYDMTNTDESEVHFTFDPLEQVKAEKYAREEKKDVMGIYHSHPDADSEAYPSEEDQRMGYSGYIYFILNFQPDETIVRAFELNDEGVTELSYKIKE